MALSRCLGSAALLFASADGARVSRKRSDTVPAAKFIAGVPILNYHVAYGGSASLSSLETEREEQWLVSLQPGATDAKIDALCKAAPKGCKMRGHPDKGGVSFLEVEGTELDLEAVIKSNSPLVKFAEPNQPVELIPELDPEVQSDASWGLSRVAANSRSGAQGSGVHIYVLDTGVRTTHSDFGSRAAPGADLSSGSLVECKGDLKCAEDRQGHGTHCAGTAAGTKFGVATKANVYGVKVLGDNGAGGFDTIVGGIDFAAASTARPAVGSMSLGGKCPLGQCGLFGIVTDAVDAAVQSGVTIVVAGGNSNSDACGFVPAFVPSAITVGSTDSLDARSSFSNYGKCTNIWAPGSAITSASHEDDTGAKTFSGTSMACPHVAGAAAIMLEQNPTYKSAQVLEKLLKNAATNYITDLKVGDVNYLLWVAPEGPPPPGNVPPPPAGSCPWHGCLLGCGGENCKYCDRCQDASLAETTASCSAVDYAIVDGMGAYSFSEKMAKCGRDALNFAFQWQANKFISCAQKVGISNSCAKCYEGAGKYGYDNCKTACLASWCSSGCLSCTAKYDRSLEKCVGRGRPTLTPCR